MTATQMPGNAVRPAPRLLAPTSRAWDDTVEIMQNVVWPFFDLAVRLWLAQAFFLSDAVKLGNWETAVYLAANEYPISWLAPQWAAVIGITVEIGGAVLLALGLLTRPAALALGTLALVIHTVYVATSVNLFGAILFGWYVVMGAGPLSLDAAMSRGLARLPIPLVQVAAQGATFLTDIVGPVYQWFLRAWIGWIFFAAGLTMIGDIDGAVLGFQGAYGMTLVPPTLAVMTAMALALVCPVLLAAGLAARLAAIPLIAMTLVV